ncbi:hybrid sensor histidine kinase/response regulator [Streptomyces ziwulingensis]|uniref:PAS domain-containing protein n=1 Tax=Streptomyces ziwulingensis TaxID=1045501 RepID=A0ABP9BH79_9ACTN
MSSRPSRGAARLAAILDALPDALVLVNANGTVVNANSIALDAFEAPGTALVGRGLLDLLPEFDSKLIPGSMRRPDHIDPRARTKPTRMVARRTDGTEFPVEVASANLDTGSGQQAYDAYGYHGDELLMLVVRDLSGTVDTEAELARSQRQTEMILRAAAEGVVGTDTDGRIVLVNPAAAQILGYRASDLGGRELHTLVLHSRADGSPFPYDESPLADTLRSGRKHRVRGQVVYAKSGAQVSVDLTTAPVRDGDQLVGAVMTFTDRRPFDALVKEKEDAAERHAEEVARLAEEHDAELTALRARHAAELEELREQHEEALAAGEERYAALGEREKDRYEALTARHEQLLTLLGNSLRGPLEELRRDLAALASDDAGQLWPEANQVLHHLSAGYSRITTLIDNVLGYQRLDADGGGGVSRTKVMLDAVVSAGVDGAVELIGPGRVQFAVHAPPIEAEVDPRLLATALAHLVADVAGVDATGNAPVSTGGYLDNTVVVAAAQRGEVVRIEVRGPYAGGDPVHEPIVRGIVRAHGGVLQTHEVPGMSGSAYVLEVPIGGGAGAVAAGAPASGVVGAAPTAEAMAGAVAATGAGAGAGQEIAVAGAPGVQGVGGGRRRARRLSVDAFLESEVTGVPGDAGDTGDTEADNGGPTGRRRRHATDVAAPVPAQAAPQAPALAQAQTEASGGTGRRRGRPAEDAGAAVGPPALGMAPGTVTEEGDGYSAGSVVMAAEHGAGAAATGNGLGGTVPPQGVPAPAGGRRARRAAGEQHALPPALPAQAGGAAPGGTGEAGVTDEAGDTDEAGEPTGRRRRALASAAERAAAQEAAPRQVFALPPAEADRPTDVTATDVTATDVPPTHVTPTAATGPAGSAGPARADGTGAAGVPVGPGGAAVPGGPGRVSMPEQAHVPAQGQVPVPGQLPVSGQPHAPVPPQSQAPAPTPQTHVPGQSQARPQGQVQVQVPGHSPLPGQRTHGPAAAGAGEARGHDGRHDAVPHDQADEHTPPQPHPTSAPTGRRRRAVGVRPDESAAAGAGTTEAAAGPAVGQGALASRAPAPNRQAAAPAAAPATGVQRPPAPRPWPAPGDTPDAGTPVPPDGPATAGTAAAVVHPDAPASAGATSGRGTPLPPENAPRAAQPLPAEAAAPVDADSTQGRAISVRTLGQGVPFNRQAAQVQQPTATPAPQHPNGSGRRRKLGTPPDPAAGRSEQSAAQAQAPGHAARLAQASEGAGRSYAIGAPDKNAAEGPEPLDGPGGAVEVADPPRAQPMDDELPPEPLDNPRRLLVWPAPDVSTQQALSDRGYRPVVVHSREEVDAQIAAFPAALFVDPLTGPITRTALQSLRQAAVAAEVPVLVTAGLGQASREAAYGADPAVLLKALAPRDSEQHPPRVLLIEEHAEIALALTATLERRGMQVARAASDADAVTLAGQFRPNLVVMDLMQVHRRQPGAGFAGIIDWLRANGQLNRTPLVVYTAAVDQADLPRLASGETVLFLAERSTSTEVQARIVELLARIGVN